METKVIAFANNKGGSGKSTACSNIAAALSVKGKRVLAIDGDMQLNLTLSFFGEDEVFKFADSGKNLYAMLINGVPAVDCIRKTAYDGIDVIPSSPLMSGAEYELYGKNGRETVMRRAIEKIRNSGDYDYVLLDCPPTLGCLVTNMLVCADYIIVPLEAGPWGLFGLANMFDFAENAKQFNKELSVLGVLVTKADTRKNYFKQTLEALNSLEGVRVFNTFVRIDSAVEWSQDNSKPVVFYRPSARASKEYTAVTDEIINILE